MNKTIIALALTSVIGSTAAVAAGNAILDVEGEIRINGQTVIDNTGKFIGLEFAQDNQVMVSDYYMQDGTYTYTYSSYCYSDFGCQDVLVIDGNTETYTSYTIVDAQGTLRKEYESNWQDNGDDTTTLSHKNFDVDGSILGEGTETAKWTSLAQHSDNYLLGTLMVNVHRHELLQSSEYPEDVGSIGVYTSEYFYGAKIAEYQIEDGTTFKNCLARQNSNIVCESIGDVSWDDGDWNLVKFEANVNAQASSQSIAGKRIDPRIIRQKLASFKKDKS